MVVDDSIYSQDLMCLLESLVSMAEDILHMKPFLIYNNYRPEKTIIKLTETMSVAFDWSFENSIGSILVGKDETELIEAVRTHRFRYYFELGFDGIFKDKHLPFVTAKSLSGPLGTWPLAVNHEDTSRIHSKLYENFEKIDTKKILDNLDPKASISDWSDVEVELVSILVEEKYGDEPDATTSTRHATSLRKLRYSSLVKVLEALGCSVRQGPGSEKVIQRKGEKKFKLGHHKRNHHVSVFKIREILKRLNIPAHQWLKAAKS